MRTDEKNKALRCFEVQISEVCQCGPALFCQSSATSLLVPRCTRLLVFSAVLTCSHIDTIVHTVLLIVLTYGKRMKTLLSWWIHFWNKLDRSWQICFEAIYWTLLWALGVPWPLRLRGELDVLERSRERSDDVPWKSLEVGHVGHEIRKKKRDDGWTELYQSFIRT